MGLPMSKKPRGRTSTAQTAPPKGEPVHKMSEGMATVPDQDIEALIEAAEECPASASSSKLNNNRSALRAGSAVA